MPTYEYRCRACGEHIEVVQSFRDDALTTCGLCGGDLRKVFSAAGIVFKGSGYYVTDSRKQPASSGGSKDKETKPKKETAASEGSAKTSEKTSTSSKAESA